MDFIIVYECRESCARVHDIHVALNKLGSKVAKAAIYFDSLQCNAHAVHYSLI